MSKNQNKSKESINILDNKKSNNSSPNKTIETKVINNTTNINIINYNNGINPSNNFIEINNNIQDNLNNDNTVSKSINIKDPKNKKKWKNILKHLIKEMDHKILYNFKIIIFILNKIKTLNII